MVDGLVKKYAGRYDIRIMNASTGGSEVGELAKKFKVEFVPTFVFVGTDGTVSATVVGAVPVTKLEQELAKLK